MVSVAAAATNAASAPVSEPAKVRAVLVKQAQLLKQNKWRAMYATYTPRFRARCNYATFVELQKVNKRVLGTEFSVRDIRARVTGSRALLAYRFVAADGRTIATVTHADGDVYVRIRGQWYDEYDRLSSC